MSRESAKRDISLYARRRDGWRVRNRQFKPTRFPNQPEPGQARVQMATQTVTQFSGISVSL